MVFQHQETPKMLDTKDTPVSPQLRHPQDNEETYSNQNKIFKRISLSTFYLQLVSFYLLTHQVF